MVATPSLTVAGEARGMVHGVLESRMLIDMRSPGGEATRQP